MNKKIMRMKTLILTPNKNEMCGMYQLAKDIEGDVKTLKFNNPLYRLFPFLDSYDFSEYDEVMTFIYPMHLFGKRAKRKGKKWIVYDQELPPPHLMDTPQRAFYIWIISKLHHWSMKGCDEYWSLKDHIQKTRHITNKDYTLYLGRKEDYKNFYWLKDTMKKLNIPFVWSDGFENDAIDALLLNCKMLVTASLWEGYGRPVMEAEALGIPAVAYDTGTHKKHIKKGICVPLGDEEKFKKAVLKVWNRK